MIRYLPYPSVTSHPTPQGVSCEQSRASAGNKVRMMIIPSRLLQKQPWKSEGEKNNIERTFDRHGCGCACMPACQPITHHPWHGDAWRYTVSQRNSSPQSHPVIRVWCGKWSSLVGDGRSGGERKKGGGEGPPAAALSRCHPRLPGLRRLTQFCNSLADSRSPCQWSASPPTLSFSSSRYLSASSHSSPSRRCILFPFVPSESSGPVHP